MSSNPIPIKRKANILCTLVIASPVKLPYKNVSTIASPMLKIPNRVNETLEFYLSYYPITIKLYITSKTIENINNCMSFITELFKV